MKKNQFILFTLLIFSTAIFNVAHADDEQASIAGKTWMYRGIGDWAFANSRCQRAGMRLPESFEINEALRAGMTQSFPKLLNNEFVAGGIRAMWTAEAGSANGYYVMTSIEGNSTQFAGTNRLNIVCVGNISNPNPNPNPLPNPGATVTGYTFRCEPQNAGYPTLDNTVKAGIQYSNGQYTSKDLMVLKFQTSCLRVASRLGAIARPGQEFYIRHCEPDNSGYTTLDTTLYQIRFDSYGQPQVNAADHFKFFSECRE